MSTKTMTPMMEQYVETKKKYQDCILFYRLGDFYEMEKTVVWKSGLRCAECLIMQ